MSSFHLKQSRRNFIRMCGVSTALLATGASAVSYARENRVLPLRRNASPLALNFNENSLGMSPRAMAAAIEATESSGNRYPDSSIGQLRETLAHRSGVKPEQIILGNGSTEVIQAVVSMVEELGAKVIEPTPTFGDVRRYSRAEGLQVIKVPVGKGFETDIRALKKMAEKTPGTLLINICNPNNPTGTIVDHTLLRDWISNSSSNHIFLIDEAYHDYAQLNPDYSSVLPIIKSGRENVILTRTFSKVYGMAGMRVGYGIAAIKTAQKVRPFAAGYNMSAPGTAAALASLDDEEFYKKSLESNQIAKSILLNALKELKLEHIKSNTNFVLHRIESDLVSYAERMNENGIKVGRKMTEKNGWNRLSIGTPQEMRIFVDTLKAFRSQGWV